MDGPGAEPPAGFEGAVDHAHQRYQSANYESVAEMLPALIIAADDVGDVSLYAQEIRSSAYVVAAKLLTKVGEVELAWVCADRAAAAATIADSVPAKSAAAYQLVCALLAAGEGSAAERLALQAAEQLTTSQRTFREPDLLSYAGALWLISAVIAARRGDRGDADRRLIQADELAARLGRDANHGWTAFGPTNVAIHRLSAAEDVDDPVAALKLGSSIDIDALPAGLRGRRGEVHVNMAWAHATLRNDDDAVSHLLAVERTAPELLKVNGVSAAAIEDLLHRERRIRTPELRGIAQRAGIS